MNLVKKIAFQFILLMVDLLLLLFETATNIVLPTRRRKGNLLTNLFVFFTSLVESLVTFERSILRTPFLFSRKYIQHGMFALAWLLFVLSYFEWSGPAAARTSGSISRIEEKADISLSPSTRKKQTLAAPTATIAPQSRKLLIYFLHRQTFGLSKPSTSIQRYIFCCILRI